MSDFASKRDQALRLEAQREAELQRQRQEEEDKLRSTLVTPSKPVDLGVRDYVQKHVMPTGPVTARQPSPTPVPNPTLAPEGEMRAPEGIRPSAPNGLMDAFLGLFGSQITDGGGLNLDPSSIWQHGSIFAPGQYENAVQARNDAGVADADQRIAAMRANNAKHRARLEQLAPPAQVLATRNQGRR